jgi:hypothetical protein
VIHSSNSIENFSMQQNIDLCIFYVTNKKIYQKFWKISYKNIPDKRMITTSIIRDNEYNAEHLKRLDIFILL